MGRGISRQIKAMAKKGPRGLRGLRRTKEADTGKRDRKINNHTNVMTLI